MQRAKNREKEGGTASSWPSSSSSVPAALFSFSWKRKEKLLPSCTRDIGGGGAGERETRRDRRRRPRSVVVEALLKGTRLMCFQSFCQEFYRFLTLFRFALTRRGRKKEKGKTSLAAIFMYVNAPSIDHFSHISRGENIMHSKGNNATI